MLQFTISKDVAKLLNDEPVLQVTNELQGFVLDNCPLTFILNIVHPIQRGAR